jgi:membrane protein involved in colicin uptake
MTQDSSLLERKRKIALDMTKGWSRAKANAAKAAKAGAADKTDKRELQQLFKSFDEGLTPKLKALENAKDWAGYTAAVAATLKVLTSYRAKLKTAGEKRLLQAQHQGHLMGILVNMEQILADKLERIDGKLIDGLM